MSETYIPEPQPEWRAAPDVMVLLPGEEVIPLYIHCPQCGCDLQQFYDGEHCRLSAQSGQQTAGSEQEHRESCGHEHLVPMIKRKFFEWVSHIRKSITGA